MTMAKNDLKYFKDYEDAANLLKDLIEFGELIELEARFILNKQEIQRRYPYKYLTYSLLIGNIRLMRSLFILLREGEPKSALLILRTIFEIQVQYLYIKIKPVPHSISYMQFSYWQIKKLHELGFGNVIIEGEVDTEKWLEQTEEQFPSIVSKFLNKKGSPYTWWHGKNISEICKSVDKQWPNKYNLENLYKGLYGFLSIESHGGPLSLGKLAIVEFGNIVPLLEPDTVHMVQIIGLSTNFTYEFYKDLVGVFNLRQRGKLRSLKVKCEQFNKK